KNLFDSIYRAVDDFKKENCSQKNLYLKRKHDIFLNIIKEIYEDYDLWNQDGGLYYNREVTNAFNSIENGEFKEYYEYIFIDEYQDINYVRCKLLQELQKINNSKLFVVGDDWQSIYGFNGSEVKLFVDFDKYFPNSETIKISENRRNCQALIDISSTFIRRNENQEKKELEYYKNENPINIDPIKLVPYDKKENKILYIEKVIQEIIESNPKKNLEILLLGRKNKDINFLINNRLFKQVYGDKNYKEIEYSKNANITIYFMSIHKSKGLEKDEVIVLNFENYDYGFPNQVDDDSVLNFIKEKEDYLFAEERRLLYVALTRTRKNVYLIYPKNNYSVFIKELKKDFKLDDSHYKINSEDLIGLNEFNHFYCGNDYKYWYSNSIPIPIEDIDYYFKIRDDGFFNEIELELYIWYEYLLKYNDPLEKAFKKLIGFNKGNKSKLKNKSLKMKKNIINSDISVLVNNKKCNFKISGIGFKSIKFTKRIIFDDEHIKKEYTDTILRRYNISIEDLERLLDI
ncbi:3'-5' exonuclease, partial [uncultured Methanobrevibacter sp.]|uniref:3'-5' exonuclease n=1 Tax=uncultured Methanobrevibacter sp. TaxID=253161 RepID=UPI00261E27F0